MKLGSKPWVTSLVCLGIGGLLLVAAIAAFSDYQKYQDWPKVNGLVIGVHAQEQYQEHDRQHSEYATVAFQKRDGVQAIGRLYEPDHVQGQTFEVFYNPEFAYLTGNPVADHPDVYTEVSLPDQTPKWVSLGSGVGGLLFLIVGTYLLWRHWGSWSFQPASTLLSTASSVVANSASFAVPPNIRTHNGAAQPTDADFFAATPLAIGELRSANTTLNRRSKPLPPFVRTVGLIVFILGPIGLSWWSLQQSHPRELIPAPVAVALLVFVTGVGSTIFLTRFFHRVTYVGTRGIAVQQLKGSRQRIEPPEILRFGDATTLWTELIRKPLGVLQYTYTWKNASGHKVHEVKGFYCVIAPVNHDYWLAKAAEKAWSEYLLERMAPEMQEKGFLQFHLRGEDWVRVGYKFLEFYGKGYHERCEEADIKSITLQSGVFTVIHRNAVWFSRRGKYSFQCSDIANLHAFLMAVERSISVPIGSGKD
jgi:hypothetical protein